MQIGFLSYPMLWQRTGGLQVQITKTLQALNMRGHDVRLVDILADRLSAFDLIHVFSVYNGNHRLVEEARAQGVKTILTPLIHAEEDRLARWRYTAASWLTGHLSRYELKTTYDDVCHGLAASSHILALSAPEKATLVRHYGQRAERISVVPNGIDPHFFTADPALFRSTHDIADKFVLIVGSISRYKNQLGVIRATAARQTPVVLIGPAQEPDYLRQCLAEGGSRVRFLDVIPHDAPLLASAYAAAGVTVLASAGESFGLTAIESLAAGTPAIITRHNGLGLAPQPPYLTFVTPPDSAELERAVHAALSAGQAIDMCRKLVFEMKWSTISAKIEWIYDHVAGNQQG